MKRPVIEVTVTDTSGAVIACDTRSAFNAGVRATEAAVRERARSVGTPYVGALPTRVDGVYFRTWTPTRGDGPTLVATVAERIEP